VDVVVEVLSVSGDDPTLPTTAGAVVEGRAVVEVDVDEGRGRQRLLLARLTGRTAGKSKGFALNAIRAATS
jgi:hypothetical protein